MTNITWIEEAEERVKAGGTEIVLDLSSVPRIDAPMAQAMEGLAGRASGTIALKGVNVPVYKALKLLKLTERFLFI
jgi:anti-anti-sigma regulatory factor